MKLWRTLAFLLAAVVLPFSSAFAGAPVVGPSTFNFTGASQSNTWSCIGGQSSFQLAVPSGLVGTFTVTVGQTSGTATLNPPWAYAPGSTTYTNTITNSGSLTVNLGSNFFVKVSDTAYTSGSATVTGSCSSAVASLSVPAPVPTLTSGNGNCAYSTGVITCTTPTPLPTAPALSGANFTNLPLNQFSGLTSTRCIQASGTTTLQAGSGQCAFKDVNNNFSADQNFNSMIINQANGVGGSLDHGFEINNLSATKPDSADSLGNLQALAPNINTSCSGSQAVSQLWPGISGSGSGNFGGYWVFWTKNSGACSGHEVLVLTAESHIFPAGPAIGAGSTSGCGGNDNQGICQITTASTCVVSVPCGTVVVNFGIPFYQPDGTTHEQPYCQFAVQDTNLATNAWTAVPEAVAYNTMTIGYAPLVAQAVARTLNIYFNCNASSY